MKNYIYQNNLIGKKQLRQLLAWSFSNYDSMQACSLADELKYLGFKYATKAGISISIEDLKVPFVKNLMLEKANQEILNSEKIYLRGKITEVERFQKIIDTWSLTSEALKDQIIYYFKNYDPLNSVYIMAFSGARGNLSQVRQLVGMRGLMADPNGQLMNLPIKKNFREGLTITDYLISGYGARKGIIDTALKTANSGYLTRRLIDVAQDILIREKNCSTKHSFLFSFLSNKNHDKNSIHEKILGRVLSKSVFEKETNTLIAHKDTQITSLLIKKFEEKEIDKIYVRSPLTCNLYRAVCQKCYGWDLTTENLVDIGEAIGILAGQSIGEPGTQLTMRTFHTGGIFTAEAREQIISPASGIIQFCKTLKTIILRTNRGEDVLVTKNSGSLILIPDSLNKNLISIDVLKNTILFCKNNQYITKSTVIGELINKNKQIKTEVKPILSDKCGEIFMPSLKQKVNLLNNNKLVWILSGQLYNSPINSFLNFYPDYKLNKYSYIVRTKLINHYAGFVKFINNKSKLSQRLLKINNNKYSLLNSRLKKLNLPLHLNNYVLEVDNLKYLVKIKNHQTKNYLQLIQDEKVGTLLKNSFKTLTGGTLYYDLKNLVKNNKKNRSLFYYSQSMNQSTSLVEKWESLSNYRTIIWLGEESYQVNCEQNILLVENGDFISEGFELIPGLFSKTSGLVKLIKKNDIIQNILIKSGLIYEGKKFKSKDRLKKLYYPGEIIFEKININNLSFCEQISEKQTEKLLIRPVQIYEFACKENNPINSDINLKNSNILNFESKFVYSYKSNHLIKSSKNLNLVSNNLISKVKKSFKDNINIELSNNLKKNCLNFVFSETFSLTNYLSPSLKYKEIQSCLLIQKNQFVSNYTLLGYLESITLNCLEIVKFKIKKHLQSSKQVFLISNNDCLNIKKEDIPDKKVNDFIISNSRLVQTGKVIIENDRSYTIQRGRPYFFPNCKNENLISKTNLQYKLVPFNEINTTFFTNRNISLSYYNICKSSIKNTYKSSSSGNSTVSLKSQFSKLFLKNKGKLYSCLLPQFFKKFSVKRNNSELNLSKCLRTNKSRQLNSKNLNRTLLLQNTDRIINKHKKTNLLDSDYQLTLLKFIEQPFLKSSKSIGLYSITEDYFEQDVNSVFCKNAEFIEANKTIGLLNLEKEITDDIVQGLPRIEEILEARKKNLVLKRIPTSQKKGLLIQKSSLDINFEFKKLATTIKETDKVNPHKLLKVYFNYYGLVKYFLCDKKSQFKFNRLINNYESSYKSFKKVQLFILNSVQAVYQSQGVNINNKHLEVIIKQMTTKVLITYEGNAPLLRREIIDLYHIEYINKVLNDEKKLIACYIPLLLGITKASLNNPSFISAASFQETTRVLTNAAIEGRIDWLRGLKENIILGHLIPAGTGSQNYRNCFKKYFADATIRNTNLNNIKSTYKNSGQFI